MQFDADNARGGTSCSGSSEVGRSGLRLDLERKPPRLRPPRLPHRAFATGKRNALRCKGVSEVDTAKSRSSGSWPLLLNRFRPEPSVQSVTGNITLDTFGNSITVSARKEATGAVSGFAILRLGIHGQSHVRIRVAITCLEVTGSVALVGGSTVSASPSVGTIFPQYGFVLQDNGPCSRQVNDLCPILRRCHLILARHLSSGGQRRLCAGTSSSSKRVGRRREAV
jgi:hypothetical protein